MRVVVPTTRTLPEVWDALAGAGVDAEAVDVSGAEDAYWRLLSELWAAGDDFCIVEHDIVVDAGTIAGMAACAEPWCACEYPYLRGHCAGLGCARFRSGLLRATPGLMDEVATMANALHPPKHWCTLDAWMQVRLGSHGYRASHRHGTVGHLGAQMPAHGCVA